MLTARLPSPQPRLGALLRAERGMALAITLIVMAAIVSLASAALIVGRSDVMISHNVIVDTQALGVAEAGIAFGENWLETNFIGPFPRTLGPAAFGSGTYTATIEGPILNLSGLLNFRITSTGTTPENGRKVVEELVSVPDFANFLGAISMDGASVHPDFDDGTGGVGRRIPDFTVDGRNHDPNGNVSNVCPEVAAFATTSPLTAVGLTMEIDELKCDIVRRANQYCNALGNGVAGPPGSCTPGLFWVRGTGLGTRYTDNAACNPALDLILDPDCCKSLDLSAAALRATAKPPLANAPAAPNDRGPFVWDTPGSILDPPLVKLLTVETLQFRGTIDAILNQAAALPEPDRRCISEDINGGTHTYGTWPTDFRITVVSDPTSPDTRIQALSNAPPCSGAGTGGGLKIHGGAQVSGAGILIVPRSLVIEDATFDWRGVVLVLEDGDFKINNSAACGAIVGTLVLQTQAGPSPKLDLDRTQATDPRNLPLPSAHCPSGFSVSYSCETFNRAGLDLLMRTISWTERFGT